MRASSRAARGSSINSSRRVRQKGATDGDALLFAPRQRGGAAVKQGGDAQKIDDLGQGAGRPPGREPAAVEQVLAHGQVRKQPGVLKDIARCGGGAGAG